MSMRLTRSVVTGVGLPELSTMSLLPGRPPLQGGLFPGLPATPSRTAEVSWVVEASHEGRRSAKPHHSTAVKATNKQPIRATDSQRDREVFNMFNYFGAAQQAILPLSN
jgi:hypothetical protein